MGRKRRIRQHRNPFSMRGDVALPDLGALLARPQLPREVDVGCAHGDFLVARAQGAPTRNIIGLEIREPMVERLQRRIARLGLENACVLFCNANRSFAELFAPASLETVYVHFPDPWFKRRHHKRRVLTPGFLDEVTRALRPGGELRLLTDFADYAEDVVAHIATRPALENPHGPGQPAPPDPTRPQTHREAWHESQGDPVHRYCWRRVDAPPRSLG